MDWRLLIEDGVDAAPGLALDEVLARRVGGGRGQPALRLYTYRPHCALVGRFQEVAREVDEAFCRSAGIAINRRPTGGGAILMGPGQLGIALALAGRGTGMHGRARDLMRRFARGLELGLERLDVRATFRGKNDLEVDGKKIAGLGVHRDPSGGLLFHASLLVDLDVALMTRVLTATAVERSSAELARVAERTTTVRELVGADLATTRVRVREGFAAAFGVGLGRGVATADEIAEQDALVREKYGTARWLQGRAGVAQTTGRASVRTAAGALDVAVRLAGRTMQAVHVRGDFFAPEAVIGDLEARLRWVPAEPDRVRAAVAAWAARWPDESLPREAVVEAVVRAAASYGCFVNPGGGDA